MPKHLKYFQTKTDFITISKIGKVQQIVKFTQNSSQLDETFIVNTKNSLSHEFWCNILWVLIEISFPLT